MTTVAATEQVDPDLVQPGWVALLIVLALAVATFLLWRSMNSQLRKIQLPKAHRPDRRIPNAAAQTDSDEERGEAQQEPDDAAETEPEKPGRAADDRPGSESS
jgi:hypothetical protein